MSLQKATRKLKRVGKKAVQFRITSTFEFIEVECKGTWRPENLRVVWLRNHRKVKSNDTTLVISEDFGPNGASGKAVFNPAIAVSLVVTLYRDANHTDFDEKEYKYHIESEGPRGKKVLATFNCNVADFVGIPSTKQALDLNFKCVSKKVKTVKLGITLESQFMKEGGALDDDMQSTFSAISTGQESLLNYDDDDEDDEEEFPVTSPTDNVQGVRGRLNTLQEEPETESDESYTLSSLVLGTGEHLKRQTLPRYPPPKPPRHEESVIQLPVEQEAILNSSSQNEEKKEIVLEAGGEEKKEVVGDSGEEKVGDSGVGAHSESVEAEGIESITEKEIPSLSPPAENNSGGKEPLPVQSSPPAGNNSDSGGKEPHPVQSLPPAETISGVKEVQSPPPAENNSNSGGKEPQSLPPTETNSGGKEPPPSGNKVKDDITKESAAKDQVRVKIEIEEDHVRQKVTISHEPLPDAKTNGGEVKAKVKAKEGGKGGPKENGSRKDEEEVKLKHLPDVSATAVNGDPSRSTSGDPPSTSGDPPSTSGDPPTMSGDLPATSSDLPAMSSDLPLTNGHIKHESNKTSSELELSEEHDESDPTQPMVDAYGREINGGGSGGGDSLFEMARSLAKISEKDKNVSVDSSPPKRVESEGDAARSPLLEEDAGDHQGGGEEVVVPKKQSEIEAWLDNEAVLVDCFGEVVEKDKLDQIDVVGLYFSAGWCPPCRRFLPKLVKLYHHIRENKKSFEIVYISSDYSKQDMMKYMKEQQMPWLGVAYEGDVSEDMRKKFKVSAVPLLKIIGRNGEIVEESAKKSAEAASNGSAILKLYNKWHEKVVPEDGVEEERVTANLQKKKGLLSKVRGKKSKESEQPDLQSQTSSNNSISPPNTPEEFGRKALNTRTRRGGKSIPQESLDEKDERIHHLEEVNRTLKQTNDELKEEMDELRQKLTQVTDELEQIKSTSKTLQAESKELIANLNMRGWLFKRGIRGITASVWRRRYFRLDQGSKLYYYKNSSEGNFQGFIDLDKVISVQEVTASQQDKNHATFTVQCDGRTFQLQAHDEPGMRKWMEAIIYMKNWRKKHAATISHDLSLP